MATSPVGLTAFSCGTAVHGLKRRRHTNWDRRVVLGPGQFAFTGAIPWDRRAPPSSSSARGNRRLPSRYRRAPAVHHPLPSRCDQRPRRARRPDRRVPVSQPPARRRSGPPAQCRCRRDDSHRWLDRGGRRCIIPRFGCSDMATQCRDHRQTGHQRPEPGYPFPIRAEPSHAWRPMEDCATKTPGNQDTRTWSATPPGHLPAPTRFDVTHPRSPRVSPERRNG